MNAEAMLAATLDDASVAASGPVLTRRTRGEVIREAKRTKRQLVAAFATPSDFRGLWESAITLIPLAGLWILLAVGPDRSWWVPVLAVAPISLLMLRSFSLLHDCGHGSLFRTASLNRAFGFIYGVVSGMPQYVWSQHHQYHHTTNGNWARYRGPLDILSVEEYDALSKEQKRKYAKRRQAWLAPLAGLLYLVVQPRVTWARGTAELLAFVEREASQHPELSLRQIARQFQTRRWKTWAEYRHMSLNNLALLSLWVLGCLAVGPALFFLVYLVTAAIAGAGGLVLFTVQHNFEGSYAGDDHEWDYDEAALYGSSFLVLPAWLNWCTANIAYHHVHHLSARIPSYRLAQCHREYERLFESVPRLSLADVRPSLDYLLWDPDQRRLLTISQHEASTTRPIALAPKEQPR